MQLKATLCICTYNGADRISRVLHSLSQQSVPCSSWEVIVIDNASTDGTSVVCEEAFRGFRGVACKVVHESQPGLSFARARASTEARAPILCFLDDDNIPSPTWVADAIEAFHRIPKAGVIGGKVLPRWEVPPTPLAEAVAPFALAICDLGDQAIRITGTGGGIVGAGMCVRTELLRRFYASPMFASSVTGRTGGNLMSGEDLAISIMARQAGYDCWYVPTMQIEHVLPARRMEMDYLLKLYEGIGRGQAAVRRLHDWKARTPLRLLLGVKDYLRWLRSRALGPSRESRNEYGDLAADLHDLQQSMTLGRARQALGLA